MAQAFKLDQIFSLFACKVMFFIFKRIYNIISLYPVRNSKIMLKLIISIIDHTMTVIIQPNFMLSLSGCLAVKKALEVAP